MKATTMQAIRYPDATDPPDLPTLLAATAGDIEPRLVMYFANATQRNLKVPNPTSGMMCWLDDTARLYVYRNGGWRPVDNAIKTTHIHSGSNLASNFSAETTIYSVVIPAADLEPSWAYEVEAHAVHGTGSAPPIGVALALKAAGTMFADSGEYRLLTSGIGVRVPCVGLYTTGSSAPGDTTFTVTSRRVSGSANYDVNADATNGFVFMMTARGRAADVAAS